MPHLIIIPIRYMDHWDHFYPFKGHLVGRAAVLQRRNCNSDLCLGDHHQGPCDVKQLSITSLLSTAPMYRGLFSR